MTQSQNLENSKHSKRGFSLMELIIAITIIAILTAGTIGVAVNYVARARKSNTYSALQAAQTGIDGYYMDTSQYPTTLNDLLQAPSDAKVSKKWAGPYWPKKNVPQDGWGNELVYKVTKGAHPYELYSWGPNGEGSDAKEHISVWELE